MTRSSAAQYTLYAEAGPVEAATGSVKDGAVGWRAMLAKAVVSNGLLVLLGLVFLLPIIWLVEAAFNSHATQSLAVPHLSFSNFGAALKAGVGGAMINSLYLAAIATIVATFTSTIAGYVLSRRHLPFKGPMLVGVLFLTCIPATLLLIPIYQIFVTLGWLNSPFFTALFLGASSIPFAIWILKNFIDQVPKEFEEAAAMEGSGEIQILWRVVTPLILPGISVAAIITFISAWGAFIIPLVIDASPGNTPGSVGVYDFMSANSIVQYGPMSAYAILFSLPVIVLYLICLRSLHGGFAFAGGVRG
jgi:multiple sugar transport system permease protein